MSKDDVRIDFDHHAADHAADPYPVYAGYRSKCPVAWSDHRGRKRHRTNCLPGGWDSASVVICKLVQRLP